MPKRSSLAIRGFVAMMALLVSGGFLVQPTEPEGPLFAAHASEVLAPTPAPSEPPPQPQETPLEPTAPPTAPPVPQPEPEPVEAVFEEGSVKAQIAAAWPGSNKAEAVRVAACESNFNPRATGKLGERGLMQIHPVHKSRISAMGYTWDDMYAIGPNLAVAWALYSESGWRPWSCKP